MTNSGLARDGIAAARSLLPDVELRPVEALNGGSGSVVTRCSITSSAGAHGTVVVKAFTGEDDGWLRESAALSVLPAGTPAPQLLAESRDPQVIVMSDVGTGGHVASALLGTDRQAADGAVVGWASALGALHKATAGGRADFGAALTARSGGRPTPVSTQIADLRAASVMLTDLCRELGVAVSPSAIGELEGIGVTLDSPSNLSALTPGDTCPDNNVVVDGVVTLLDFEAAQWRHVAWDLAYLVVPWPTCWCAWRIPQALEARAFDTWTQSFDLRAADRPALQRDVADAVVAWTFMSAAWLLPRALADDAPLRHPLAPRRRAMVLSRLDDARRNPRHDELSAWADRLHAHLADRWGTLTMDRAPAFRQLDGQAGST